MKLRFKLIVIGLFFVGLLTAVFLQKPLATIHIANANECSNTSVGFIPLIDLGSGTYEGAQGGLYPGGGNGRPAAHEAAGLAIAQTIHPLNAQGQPDPNGIIGVASMGMSNVFQEYAAFQALAENDTDINPEVTLVNLGNPGVVAQAMANPDHPYWTTRVPKTLNKDGVTYEQIQVIWLKQNRGFPSEPFPEFAQLLQRDLTDIIHLAHEAFPNLKMMYVSSRIYAGYSTDDLNPEPYSYQSGFGFKWVVEAQINGDPALNYDPDQGDVNAPWLAWGPYMWADGTTPRSDGLIWECSDLEEDGVHPAESGEAKVATFLLNFFKTDSTTKTWFGEGNPLPPPPSSTPTPIPSATATPDPGSGADENNFLPLIVRE